MNVLLAQAETALQAADKVAGLPAAGILALVAIALGWYVLQQRQELKDERAARKADNDAHALALDKKDDEVKAVRREHIADLKETLTHLGKEAA